MTGRESLIPSTTMHEKGHVLVLAVACAISLHHQGHRRGEGEAANSSAEVSDDSGGKRRAYWVNASPCVAIL